MKKNVRLIAFGVLVLALVAGAFLLPVKHWLIAALEWTEGLGLWAPIFVVGFYVVACILLLPGSVLTLGAGLIFGVPVGTITVSFGSTLGACVAFLIGRTVARDWVAEKVRTSEKFSAIDEAVGEQGFKIVLLTRLSPVFPFNFLNYAYGLTQVPFRQYALGSWIGMIPGTIMYVYLGAGLRSLSELAAGKVEGGTAQRIFFWCGLAATVVVTVFITHIARKTLRKKIPAGSDPNRDESAPQ